MTRVRSRKTKNYAKTDNHQRLLMLDGYGQINVIIIDNLDHFLNTLNLRKNKQLAVEDLLNANLVYSLAMQLNLNPGIYKEADDLIWAYIQSHISEDVVAEDKALLMQELKDSWQRIHEHPLAKRYIPLGDHQRVDRFLAAPPFAGFGGFAIFMKDYLTCLIGACLTQYGELPAPFCLLMDLHYCSLQGLHYFANPFLMQEHVIECLKWRCELEPSQALVRYKERLEERLKAQKGEWFVRVLGAVRLDLEEIEVDHPLEAGHALAKLLEGQEVSTDDDLKLQLAPLMEYIRTDTRRLENFIRSVKFLEVKEGDTLTLTAAQRELFVAAICYGVIYYAQTQSIFLKPPREVPICFWAGKGLANEEKIVSFLQTEDNRISLKNYELEALCKYAQHALVKEIVMNEKRRRAQYVGLEGAFAAMSLGNAFVAPLLFRSPMPGIVAFPNRGPVGSAVRPVEVKFEDEIPDAENMLTLREAGSCVIL